MGKRKLRNCTNCGSLHGPPTGKNCIHAERPERKEESDVMAEPKPEAAAIFETSAEDQAEACGPDCGAEGHETDEDQLDFTFSLEEGLHSLGSNPDQGYTRPKSPGGSGAKGAMFLRQQLKEIGQERTEFKKRVDGKITHMENVLGIVAGVQQAQLQRLIDLFDTQKKSSANDEKPGVTCKQHQATAVTAATGGEPEMISFDVQDLSDTVVPEANISWKDYHGYAAWHQKNAKKKKNPFDHQAFIKKGEKVVSFEDLMVVLFKTMSKMVEMKGDVKGAINHGLFMSEKASKNVFINEAFVSYDEDVRKRAGDDGPSAFGTVLQEDVFTHFCLENTKKQRAAAKQQSKPTRVKADKICHRFNDAGCTSKTCTYSHKCSSCEGWGHSKKNCGEADKKKEGK